MKTLNFNTPNRKQLLEKIYKAGIDYSNNLEKTVGYYPRKILIIRHNDLDGATSAFCVAESFANIYDDFSSISVDYSFDFTKCNYESIETLFILDFSLNQKHVDQLKSLNLNIPIVWIDHHTSSFDIYKVNEEWFNMSKFSIVLYEEIGISGTMLSYLFSNMYNNEIDYDIISVPDLIKLVSDYDTFSPDADFNFFYAIDSINYDIETFDGYNTLASLYYEETNKLQELIKSGKIISRYINKHNKTLVDSQYFRFKLILDDNTSFNMAAINAKANSLIFGDIMEEIDGVIVYYQRSDLDWNYSVFTGKKCLDIDCGKIAKKFKGGGRRECAGFILNYNIFDIGACIEIDDDLNRYINISHIS